MGVGVALQRIWWIHRELSFGRKKIQENPASLNRAGGGGGGGDREQPGYSGPVAHQNWGAMRLRERRARRERMWLGWMSLIGDIEPQAWGVADGIGKS